MLYLFTLLFVGIQEVASLKFSECKEVALGMESGSIKDSQLTASSSFDIISVGPQNARIRKELASGAWCPKPQIKPGSYEYLEVDLKQVYLIRAIETQGRYGNGTGREFTTQYMVDYLRMDSGWIRYHNRSLIEVLDGNDDTENVVVQILDPPLVASRIRIVPYSTHARTTCLRVEFYGCLYTEGLMFYSTSIDGSRIGDHDFRDHLFERVNATSKFGATKKGLGLLTDGVVATTNPLETVTDRIVRSQWIGWNQFMSNGSTEIIFEFDELRRFAYVELWAWGTSLKTTEVFFSNDGMKFALSSQISSIQRRMSDATRNLPIRIPLHNRSGIALKIKLSYMDQWLFLSEVYFSSSVVKKITQKPKPLSATSQVYFNSTTVPIEEETTNIFPALYFIGLVLFFFLIMCIICGILITRRRHLNPKDYNAGKAKIMVTSIGEKGFCTNFYDEADADYHQIRNGGFYHNEKKIAMVSKRSKKNPSWSDFHFPPPPADMYGISESSIEPLLGAPTLPTTSPPREPRERNRTWPKRSETDDCLHYAASPICKTEIKFKQKVVRVDPRTVILESEIGRGRYTVVRSCTIVGKKYAAKLLTIESQQARKVLEDEVKILSMVDHENIIKIHGVDDSLTIYLHLAQYGSIRTYLNRRPETSYLKLLAFVIEVASGMKYLEQRRIIHGHLSPQCILVDHNAVVKISSPRGIHHHAQLRYSAPESIIANEWSSKGDVWSFAVSAWEIFNACATLPFAEFSNSQLLENTRCIYDGAEAVYLRLPHDLPQQTIDLLTECWQRYPADRPTFLELHQIFSMKNSCIPVTQNGSSLLRNVTA